MNKNKRERKFLKGFKSIQSTIFAAVSVLVLCAVLAATAVSVRYTNSTVYENSAIYTQTIIHQLNQNVDSYITYMDNIASVIAKSQDAYQLLYQRIGEDEAVKEGHRKRLQEQFSTILKGRDDIYNIGIVQKDGVMLINSGYQATNPDLDLSTQEWYTNAVDNYNQYCLSSSHVQHVIKGQRPWVITLSREVHNFYGTGNSDGVVFIDLNYSAISELCDQNSIGDKGYVFILDQDGNIVYHPSQQQLYNELQTENIDPETTREFVADIGDEAARLERITEDLLRLTRLDSGILEQAAVEDVLPVLEQVMRMMSLVAQEKGTELTYRAEGTCTMLATRDEIHQIIYNLTDNAVKYTPAGGQVTITVRPWQFYTRIDITDTGIGIPEGEYHQVFQRFYRSQAVADQEGVGLGLYLARGIITRQRGYISVKSKVGEGTTFSVYLLREMR